MSLYLCRSCTKGKHRREKHNVKDGYCQCTCYDEVVDKLEARMRRMDPKNAIG